MRVKKRGFVFIVLTLFSLVLLSGLFFSLVSAEIAGCYVYSGAAEDLYCASGISNTQAQEDCETYANCDIKKHFLPGNDCV